MNFFQGSLYTANRTEDHSGNDNVDAVVQDFLHILGETDDETFHFDVRMIDLFLKKLILEKWIDFHCRQFAIGRIKFEIVTGTGSDFKDSQSSLLPQFRID